MEKGEFIEEASGAAFRVEVYKNLSYKYPKEPKSKSKKKVTVERMQEIAAVQTEVSKKVPGVLPAWVVGEMIVMPTAPGTRLDRLPKEEREKALAAKDVLLKKIAECGYVLKDMGARNLFWSEGQLYPIDWHLMKKAEEA